jgi:hypothetical protein
MRFLLKAVDGLFIVHLQALDHIVDTQADDSQLSMMERRPWTQRLHRRLPKRFRDVLPQPPPHLPPSPILTNLHSQSPQANFRTIGSCQGLGSLRHRIRQVFTTGRNMFGLSRQYEATELPSHDRSTLTRIVVRSA